MDTFGSIVRAVVWGICVLILLAWIFMAGAAAWIGLDARVSTSVASEAARTLADIGPTLANIEALRKHADAIDQEEEWEEHLKTERYLRDAVGLLEKEVEPYCDKMRCISWIDDRYKLYDDIFRKREEWAKDLPRMLERHANPDEIRSYNWIQAVKVALALIALVLLLYLFVAFIKYFRIGWKRLAALAVLVLPPTYVLTVFSLRKVDELWGNLELSGTSVNAAMLICLLYPFVVIPPLWVLNKKAGRSVSDGLAYWRDQQAT